MSAPSDQAPARASCPPPASARVAEWARVLGAGSIHRDFGHSVATNAQGDILVAARLERLDEDDQEHDDAAVDTSRRDDSTVDLSGAELVKLARDGERAWAVRLRAARFLRAPCIALDAAGSAYVAGPYAPADGALRGAREMSLTKLGPGGAVEWTQPLFEVPLDGGRPRAPVVRVAADPAGGACVTWIGERRRWPAVRAVRFTNEGSIAWDQAWPVISGDAYDPHIGLDDSGAAVVWGTFRGTLAMDDGVKAESGAEARYLARVQADGRVRWAYSLRAYPNTPYAMAVGSGGEIGQAHLVPAAAPKSADAPPLLALMRIDTAGAPLPSARGRIDRHSSISSLSIAPTVGGGFALAGYFSGALRLGGTDLRSVTPASEALFVAHAAPDGDLSGRAYQGPQLQAGLSIHGGAVGAVLVSGWLCGTMVLGSQKIASPSDRAALFVANLSRP